jgi:hypothetical protein
MTAKHVVTTPLAPKERARIGVKCFKCWFGNVAQFCFELPQRRKMPATGLATKFSSISSSFACHSTSPRR